ACRDFPERGDIDHEKRSARRIATDQVGPVAVCEREQALRERPEPGFIRRRQGNGERRPARDGARRRQVRKTHRERLVAERACVRARKEMPPFDQHVGRDRDLETGPGGEQRAIIADAEHRMLRRALEVPPDDLEFVQAIFLERATSSGRSAAALFSSTPLMKRWPSVRPKLFPSSTATRTASAPLARRAIACGSSWVVRMPLAIGRPKSSATAIRPRADSFATTSKW